MTIKKDSSGEAIVSEPVRPLFARDRRALPLFGASPKAIDFSDSYEGEFELPSSIKPGRYVVTIRGECHDPLREVAYIGPAMKPLDFKREKKPLKIVIKTKNTDGERRGVWNDPPASVLQTTLERLKSLGIRESSVKSLTHRFVKNFYKKQRRPKGERGDKGGPLLLRKAGELWEISINFLSRS